MLGDERHAGARVRAELPEDEAESIDLGLGAVLLVGGRLWRTHAHAELLQLEESVPSPLRGALLLRLRQLGVITR